MPVAGRKETFHEHSLHWRNDIAKLLLTNSALKGIMIHNKVRVRFMGDYIPLPDRGVGPNTCRRDELKIVTFITGMDDGKNKKNI